MQLENAEICNLYEICTVFHKRIKIYCEKFSIRNNIFLYYKIYLIKIILPIQNVYLLKIFQRTFILIICHKNVESHNK